MHADLTTSPNGPKNLGVPVAEKDPEVLACSQKVAAVRGFLRYPRPRRVADPVDPSALPVERERRPPLGCPKTRSSRSIAFGLSATMRKGVVIWPPFGLAPRGRALYTLKHLSKGAFDSSQALA